MWAILLAFASADYRVFAGAGHHLPGVGGLTRQDAAVAIKSGYLRYYEEPIVTVKIAKYTNNKDYVLGRVRHPGVVNFAGPGSLLEALTLVGGLTAWPQAAVANRCYIVRGSEQIIWVDLQQLLQRANTKLNVRLTNNDLVYVPIESGETVFVMGAVKNPGTYQIQADGLRVLGALSQAGGPTEDADTAVLRLIRSLPDWEGIKLIDVAKMWASGDLSSNYRLMNDDIIYVPKRGIAEFNYYLRQVDPFMRTFISGTIIREAIK